MSLVWKLTLEELPGIGKKINLLKTGKYPGINKVVNNISDLNKSIIDKLPIESQIALYHLTGDKYPREIIKYFETKYLPKICVKLESNKCLIAGSYRRNAEFSSDIDLIALVNDNYYIDYKKKLELLLKNGIKFINSGNIKSRFIIYIKKYRTWIPIDLVFVTENNYIPALLHYTGSKNFNISMSKQALIKGYKLSENGLFKNGKQIKVESEKEIFNILKRDYKEPEDRL